MRNFILFIPILLFAQCNRTQSNCEQAMCTMEFRFVTVTLKDQTGKIFIADKVETYISNATLIHSKSSPTISIDTSYTVVDDSHLKLLNKNVDNELTFKIYKGGSIVHQSKYIITADCCHIAKKSGDSEIKID